jgi:hypothetical protein
MPQASVCDSCSLEALSLSEDCLGPSKVDVGRGLADRLQRSTKSPILILPPRELPYRAAAACIIVAIAPGPL